MPRRTFVSKLDRYGFPRPRKRETPISELSVDAHATATTQPALPIPRDGK